MNIVIPKANTHKASIVSEAEKAIADREAVEKKSRSMGNNDS